MQIYVGFPLSSGSKKNQHWGGGRGCAKLGWRVGGGASAALALPQGLAELATAMLRPPGNYFCVLLQNSTQKYSLAGPPPSRPSPPYLTHPHRPHGWAGGCMGRRVGLVAVQMPWHWPWVCHHRIVAAGHSRPVIWALPRGCPRPPIYFFLNHVMV